MTLRIAINGFGRIGRCIVRALQQSQIEGLDIVAINDLMRVDTAAHLLKFDSVHGNFNGTVEVEDSHLVVNGNSILFLNEKEPDRLPWRRLDADIVIESTGIFTSSAKAGLHLKAGAGRVLISGPSRDADYTVVSEINSEGITPEHRIISNGSCTTNCLAVISDVLIRQLGFEAAMMSTIHAYTADQSLVDTPHDDLRRARAAALSIIPTATGAARAIGQVLPGLDGKIAGLALRVPVPNVSLLELVAWSDRETDHKEINEFFKKEAQGKLKKVLAYSDDALVSIDFLRRPESAIFDATQTLVVRDRLIRVAAWYDNEWAFANRMIEITKCLEKI